MEKKRRDVHLRVVKPLDEEAKRFVEEFAQLATELVEEGLISREQLEKLTKRERQ